MNGAKNYVKMLFAEKKKEKTLKNDKLLFKLAFRHFSG